MFTKIKKKYNRNIKHFEEWNKEETIMKIAFFWFSVSLQMQKSFFSFFFILFYPAFDGCERP